MLGGEVDAGCCTSLGRMHYCMLQLWPSLFYNVYSFRATHLHPHVHPHAHAPRRLHHPEGVHDAPGASLELGDLSAKLDGILKCLDDILQRQAESDLRPVRREIQKINTKLSEIKRCLGHLGISIRPELEQIRTSIELSNPTAKLDEILKRQSKVDLRPVLREIRAMNATLSEPAPVLEEIRTRLDSRCGSASSALLPAPSKPFPLLGLGGPSTLSSLVA